MTSTCLQLHQRLLFDLAAGQVLDGPRRYVLMRADVLMGAFDHFPQPAREQALQALGTSVTRFGADSVRAYLAQVGPDALLQAMVQGSASLGWGSWTFRRDGTGLWLEVRNSPFAAGSRHRDGGPVCHAIAGMLEAVAQTLEQAPMRVREVRCAACEEPGGPAICLFHARPASPEPAH
ncbi:V4R domain-containing protein [Delftia deserti]|uniref:V4R domain-containing protein n=1 Tax=Delftia deserti TaxID=1651218 RepID=A0ABW5ENF7_9BURK